MLDIRNEVNVVLVSMLLPGYLPSTLVLDVFVLTDLLPPLGWPILSRSTEEYRHAVVLTFVINAYEAAVPGKIDDAFIVGHCL